MSTDTRDLAERIATRIVMKFVGCPSLSAHDVATAIIRAELAESPELREVRERSQVS